LRPHQFSRGQKSEKCIERAESLTETLATQASDIVSCIFNVFGEIWFLIQQTSSTAEDKKNEWLKNVEKCTH